MTAARSGHRVAASMAEGALGMQACDELPNGQGQSLSEPRGRSCWTHCPGGGDARCHRTGALPHRRTTHARLQAMGGSSSAVGSAAPRSFGPQPGGFRSLHGRRVWPGASCHFLHGRWHGARRSRDISFISLAALLFGCCNYCILVLQQYSWHVAIVRLCDAIVSRLCCRSLCTCCICVLGMLRVSHANVSKLGLNFSMLQTLIFDVADAESRCCRHVLLGVANIKF
jgi:hypothetical protein